MKEFLMFFRNNIIKNNHQIQMSSIIWTQKIIFMKNYKLYLFYAVIFYVIYIIYNLYKHAMII